MSDFSQENSKKPFLFSGKYVIIITTSAENGKKQEELR
jgi:hypothetical protein